MTARKKLLSKAAMQELVISATILLTLFSLTPYIPAGLVVFDLPSHFVLQYAVGAVILLLATLVFRTPLYVPACLVVSLLLNLWQLSPFYIAQSIAGTGTQLKIMQVNTLFLNQKTSLLEDLIVAEKPDLVLASEVNEAFGTMLEGLKGDYPHQFILPKNDSAYGLAILSKIPLSDKEVKHFDRPEIPALTTRINHDGRDIDIVSIHPATPVKGIGSRNNEFAQIAKWFEDNKPENAILAGDFNATPFCHTLKELQSEANLLSARNGKGYHGSWPVWLPPIARIPIDHILLRGNIVAMEYRILPDIGSDHLPSMATLAFR